MGIKRLSQASLSTGSGSLLYTVPTGYNTNILTIDIANTTGSPINATMHFVQSGSSVSASNMIVPAVEIPGNTMVQWTGIQRLETGDFIQGIGSASGITVNISGDELR